MYRKKFWLIFILILSLGFLFSSAAAQDNTNEDFEIWPVYIDPPDGTVDILVPPDENIVIRTSFRSCSKPLSRAWKLADVVSLAIDGEQLLSTRKESWEHWSNPIPVPNEDGVPCVNGSDTLWVVDWEYDLGMLEAGYYQVHFEENVKYLFTDGADYDDDGRRDFFRWNIAVDFNIIINEGGGSISGWVKDDAGDPVVDIWVGSCEESVSEDEWGSHPLCRGAATNENGFYTIQALQPGNYRVVIWGDEIYVHQFFDHTFSYYEAELVDVVDSQTSENINFDLILGGSISGWVFDDAGEPVVDIWVDSCEENVSEDEWGYHPLCKGATTNENGFYTIQALQPGNYRVVIWGDELYIPQFFDNASNYDEAELVEVVREGTSENVNFYLVQAGSISGHVYEANSGDPPVVIEGVHVDACSIDDTLCNGAETNEVGEYTINGLLPDKTYRVFVWGQPGWANELYQETIWWDEATLVSVGTTGIDFTLSPGGSISGVVYDANGPLANIGVDIVDGGYGTCTDVNGQFAIAGLPLGTYDIVAGRDFCGAHPYIEQIITDVTLDTETPDVSGYDFTLTAGGSISGMVTADGGGLIGDNIDVSACFEDGSVCRWTSVQSDGTYVINGVPTGEYLVHAYQWPEGYWIGEVYDNTQDWDAFTPVSVTVGSETSGINFTLEQGGAITGVVEDAAGIPIEGLWVVANDYAGDYFVSWAETDASGTYRILGLPAGDYRVFINPQNSWTGGVYSPSPVTVTAGVDTFDVDFTLAQDSTISGTVTDALGNHIPERIDVAACLAANTDICWWTTVGEDDTYTIVGLLAGEYVINVYEVEDPGGNWIGQTYPTNIILREDEDATGINFMLEAVE